MSTEIATTYTIDQVAHILECAPETAVERIVCGDLPGLKIGRSWIIPVGAFTQRLNELALEQSQARRHRRTALTGAAKVIQKAQHKGRRGARVPPALPSSP